MINAFFFTGCRDGASKNLLFDNIEAAGLPSTSIEWINLDMSSMDSVRSFGQTILDKNVPISLLINNGMTYYLLRYQSCAILYIYLTSSSWNNVYGVQSDERRIRIAVCGQLSGPFPSYPFADASAESCRQRKRSCQGHQFVVNRSCLQIFQFRRSPGKVCHRNSHC